MWEPPPPGPNATPPWELREAALTVQGKLRNAALDLGAQVQQGQRKFDLSAPGSWPARWARRPTGAARSRGSRSRCRTRR
jgi:hypothetical protein